MWNPPTMKQSPAELNQMTVAADNLTSDISLACPHHGGFDLFTK